MKLSPAEIQEYLETLPPDELDAFMAMSADEKGKCIEEMAREEGRIL